ncbi:cytochrome b/b6 domain-containing protein [Oricola sp.]|uniref:cytochrome b n=1 Tax=Oricola sp. TaxID=1979950 RepID=UPI0025D0CE6C|nr:cytochrome b/b6 domain-containing protein [Oricola sp.]MCI5077307.1 hypothetical protein [Oricola sp.]
MSRRDFNPKDRFAAYSLGSVISHWLSAIIVVVLYINHADDPTPAHLGLGLIAAPFLLLRVQNRFRRGYARMSDHSAIYNFATRLVMTLMLVCILALALSGILLPALTGNAYDIFGWVRFTLPFPPSRTLGPFMQTVHAIAGHAVVILAVIHVFDTVAQQFYDRSTILVRMLRPVKDGK